MKELRQILALLKALLAGQAAQGETLADIRTDIGSLRSDLDARLERLEQLADGRLTVVDTKIEITSSGPREG